MFESSRADMSAGYERERKARILNLVSKFVRGGIRHSDQSVNFFFEPDAIEYSHRGRRETFARRTTVEVEDGFYPMVTVWPSVVDREDWDGREKADFIVDHLRRMNGSRDAGNIPSMFGFDHDFDFIVDVKD